MFRQTVSTIMLALLLTSMLVMAFNIRQVKAEGIIYIRADGSIDPPTAPISTIDNVTYTFTDDLFGGLGIEKDNVVINGANYTLHASGYVSGWPTGVYLSGRTNVTIEYVRIETFTEGIYVTNSSGNRLFRNIITSNESDTHPSVSAIIISGSSNNSVCENNIRLSTNATPEPASSGISILLSSSYNTISANKIENTFEGIGIQESPSNYVLANTIRGNYYGIGVGDANNTISENNVTSGIIGIDLERCSNTAVSGNNVTENSHNGITLYPGALSNVLYGNYIASSDRGIILWQASNNSIYHNSFVNNSQQVYIIESGFNNSWDNGYPSGGNYWSDYDGTDLKSGPLQNVTGNDGIGDTPYVIDENNTDHYPLMKPYAPHAPLIGDINNDGKVDMIDIGIVVSSFGSAPGYPRWNPLADVNHDGKVDIRDIAQVAKHFGEHT